METWAALNIDTRGAYAGQIKTYCPQCHSRRKREHQRERELSVNLNDGVYFCHNCGWTGRVLPEETWTPRAPKPAAPPPTVPTERTLTPTGLHFLAERGISAETARAAGLYDDGKALAFPYTRGGQVVHIKYRSLTDKAFWSTKDTPRIFYGLDWCAEWDAVHIVEGELDALALRQAGITNVLSVPDGAPQPGSNPGAKLACLRDAADYFEDVSRIVIAVDADAAGYALADALVSRLGPERCFRAIWPADCKDANDTLRQYGEDALRAAIRHAKPEPIDGLIYADDVREKLWASRLTRTRQGFATGWASVDELYRPKPEHLTVLTGTPSSGKSAFMSALMMNMARLHDWTFGIFTPEMFPPDEYFLELAQIHAGCPLEQMSREQYDAAMDFIHEHIVIEAPDEPTLPNILRLAGNLSLRHGVKGIVIDPFTNVQSTREPGKSETEYIGEALSKVQQFGQRHACHMWVLAHPTKPDKAKGNGPVGPYDVSGSANWFNKADNFLSIYRVDRNDPRAPVELHVMKMRNRRCGKVGMTQLQFDITNGRYRDVTEEWSH